MQRSDGLFSALADVSRRDFMKLCTALASTMGLSSKAGAEMTAALTEPKRPPVLWIGAQECTGCTESLLRATHPTVENLVLENDFLGIPRKPFSAAFGEQAEDNKHNAMKKYYGKYVLVVEWFHSGERRWRLLHGGRQTDCGTHSRSRQRRRCHYCHWFLCRVGRRTFQRWQPNRCK